MANITKSQKRLLIVLLFVVAYAVYDFASNWDNYFGFYKGKKAGETAAAGTGAKVEKTAVKVKSYDLSWKSDPFYLESRRVRNVSRKPTETSLHLKAISYAGESSVAMINSKIMSVGDVIAGYKVLKIEEKKVILGKGANSKVLTLK